MSYRMLSVLKDLLTNIYVGKKFNLIQLEIYHLTLGLPAKIEL